MSYSEHKPWELAENANACKPNKPDGYYKGRPYFFYQADPDRKDVGYHIWWDSNLPEIIEEIKTTGDDLHLGDDDYIVDLGAVLEIRGGLSNILKGVSVEEIFTALTESNLTHLLKEIPHSILTGDWLDLASGTGLGAERALISHGAKRVIHVDNKEHHKETYLKSTVNSQGTSHKNFIVQDVTSMKVSDLPRGFAPGGITFLHPYGDPKLFGSVFPFAEKILPPNGHIVVINDSEDTKAIQKVSQDHGFVGKPENFAKGGIGTNFRRIT